MTKTAKPRKPSPKPIQPRNRVFLIHGRDIAARNEVIKFIHAVGLQVLGWGVVREQIGLPNPSTMDIIRQGIAASDITVVLFTGDDLSVLHPSLGVEKRKRQPRPNVVFEAGWALALRPTQTVLAQLGDADLLSDIVGVNVCRLTNFPEHRRDFVRRLRDAGSDASDHDDAWLDVEQSGDFSTASVDFAEEESDTDSDPGDAPSIADESHVRTTDDNPLSGMSTEWIVDTGLSMRLSSSRLFEEMRIAISAGKGLELKYHYVGPKMAEYWMGVVEDKDYGHDLLAETTQASVQEILEAGGLRNAPFDYVSLGPGAGEFDGAFVKQLVDLANLHAYYPVDISMDLLQFAVARVQREFVESGDTPPRMRAFVADFEEGLEDFSLFMMDDHKALFSLTGFTLGNSREDKLIEAISLAMRPGDVALVDCRLHGRGTSPLTNLDQADVNTLMKPYGSDAVKRFAFGPVEVASDFAISSENVTLMKSVYRQRHSVPSSINVMLECTDLYLDKPERTRFLRKMGFDPATTSGKMRLVRRGKKFFELAMVTFYDFGSLSAWFNNRDLKIQWSKNVGDKLGIFLLEKQES